MKPLLTPAFLLSGYLSAQTVLISPTVRNGGFEDFNSTDFATTPFWESYFTEGASADPTLPNNPKTGALRGFTNGFQEAGDRFHPFQIIPAADWTLQEGDRFVATFSARSGFNFDIASDQVQVILHVVDSSGAPVNDATAPFGFTDRILSAVGSLDATGVYKEFTFASQPIPAGSDWIGNQVQIRLLNTGARDKYNLLDDISLTGFRAGDLSGDTTLLASYQAEGNTDDSTASQTGIADPGLAYSSGFGIGQSFATNSGGLEIPFTLPNSASITFWIRTEQPGSTGTSFSWRDGSAILDSSASGSAEVGVSLVGDRIAFGTSNSTLFSRTLVTDDRWHHVAVTRSQIFGSMQLFIDGQLEDFTTAPSTLPASNSLSLGRNRAGAQAFDGLLDDIQIYEGILDQAAINTIRIGTGDSDGDGSSNEEELEAGTDWGNAEDRLQAAEVTHTGSEFAATVEGRQARAYELQRLDSLSATTASTVDSKDALVVDESISLVDENPPTEKGFYKVTAAKTPPSKPNILLIVGDDHGYADLSAYAHSRPDIATPNLDRIAAAGVRFTQAYVTAPVCSPSRCGFLTGRQQNEWEPRGGWSPGLPAQAKHLAEYLKEADYNTAMIGKSDFGPNLFRPIGREYPPSHGFDEFFGFSAHAHDFFLHSQEITDTTSPAWPGEASAHLGQFLSSEMPTEFETLQDGVWQTTEFTDRAIDFVQEQETETDPFFLYLSHASVHALIHQVPKSYLDEEGVPELPLYDPTTNVPGNPSSYNSFYFQYSRPNPQVASGIIADADFRKYYRAHLKAYDVEIGRLLDSLESTGQLDNTIIIYFSDNGGEALTGANNLPLSGSKYNLFEGGIRVPFLMSWPGVLPANQAYTEVISTLDVTPTLLEAAGIEEAPQLRGFSLIKPVKENKPVLNTPRTLFWRFNDFWAIRRGNYKLVFSGKGIGRDATTQIQFTEAFINREALFNLANDPGELIDLSNSADATDQLNKTELKALFDAWDAANQN